MVEPPGIEPVRDGLKSPLARPVTGPIKKIEAVRSFCQDASLTASSYSLPLS